MVRNGWFDEECKEMFEEQDNARLKMLQRKTRNNIEAYNKTRRKVRRKKKKDYKERTLEEIQEK
jgi:hypothetical protein